MIPIPPQVLIKIGAKILPQLIGAGMSYAQAAQQKKEMKSAEEAAAKAMADARAKLFEAPLERLQVPTEAYENAMREITAQSMQYTEAARESGARELAASVGRLGAMGLTATEQQREAMAQDIYKRDAAVAEDEARRLGLLSQLDVRESMGAQLAAAQAAEQRGAALTSATENLGSALGTAFGELPLYMLSPEAMRAMKDKRALLGRPGGTGTLNDPMLSLERQQISSNLGALQEELFSLDQFQPIPYRP